MEKGCVVLVKVEEEGVRREKRKEAVVVNGGCY